MHIVILKMLFAVVENPQMPLLLLLKLHIHNKSYEGASAAAAAAARHRVPDDAIE